ncbi:TniB family NTP-binding protein [Yoonia sp. MH D7]
MAREPKVTIDQIKAAGRIAATLSQRFVKTNQQTIILNKLLLLNEERNCLASMGSLETIDGMAIVAPTGSGKTRTLDWVFSEVQKLNATGIDGEADHKIISVRVRTPANLRTAAEAVMKEIGYPVAVRYIAEAALPTLWEKVHFQLKAKNVTILHLDEAQDIWGQANKPQRKAVINTLKSLSQNKEWPVILVLSGTEEMKEMLNVDQQLGRRIKPTEITPIAKATDAKTVRSVITSYVAESGLSGFTETDPKFIDRFFVACCNRLGIAVKIIIGAIQQAVLVGDTALDQKHFTRAFTHISDCEIAMNPFIAEDWQDIDASKLWATKEDEGHDEAPMRSPRVGRKR